MHPDLSFCMNTDRHPDRHPDSIHTNFQTEIPIINPFSMRLKLMYIPKNQLSTLCDERIANEPSHP